MTPWPPKPVFDFRAHICHSALMETRFRLQTSGERPGGQKAISYQFAVSVGDSLFTYALR
jgi:hypothetical protein